MQRPEKRDIRIREAQNVAYEKLNGLIFLKVGSSHRQQEIKEEEEMVVARPLRTLDGSHKCEL